MVDINPEAICELIVVDHKTLPILFSEGKADSLVDEIEKKVRSFVPDVETKKGRKDISSLAHKIARSKVTLDNAGKQLTADWKARAKIVDQERARVWKRLETLQEEIRGPLTEYEEKEKQRVSINISALDYFKTILQVGLNYGLIDQIEKAIKLNKDHFDLRNWEEYQDQAKELYEKCDLILKEKLSNKKLEIEAQKREEAERKLKEEQEERERAQKKAEEESEFRIKMILEHEAEEKKRFEREQQQAEERAIKAEQDRLKLLENAKAEKLAAEEKSKRDIEEAVKLEREESKRRASDYEKHCDYLTGYIASQQPLPEIGDFKPQEELPVVWNVPEGIVGKCDLTCDTETKILHVKEELEKRDRESNSENPEFTLVPGEPFYSPIPDANSGYKPNAKVYIVFSHYEPNSEWDNDPVIMGVFSTRELAEANMLYADHIDPYIEEHEVIE